MFGGLISNYSIYRGDIPMTPSDTSRTARMLHSLIAAGLICAFASQAFADTPKSPITNRRAGTTVIRHQPKLEYLRDIRPILAANCFTCHGMDDKKRQAGLRLDN